MPSKLLFFLPATATDGDTNNSLERQRAMLFWNSLKQGACTLFEYAWAVACIANKYWSQGTSIFHFGMLGTTGWVRKIDFSLWGHIRVKVTKRCEVCRRDPSRTSENASKSLGCMCVCVCACVCRKNNGVEALSSRHIQHFAFCFVFGCAVRSLYSCTEIEKKKKKISLCFLASAKNFFYFSCVYFWCVRGRQSPKMLCCLRKERQLLDSDSQLLHYACNSNFLAGAWTRGLDMHLVNPRSTGVNNWASCETLARTDELSWSTMMMPSVVTLMENWIRNAMNSENFLWLGGGWGGKELCLT